MIINQQQKRVKINKYKTTTTNSRYTLQTKQQQKRLVTYNE